MEQGEIILYQPDETIKLEVRMEGETVWLTQEQIADLFGTKRPAITKHLNNIYNSGELDVDSTCSILEHMGNDGKQKYTTKYYNLDAILSVGYRVNSKNATLFRRWASTILKEYLLKGYSINQRLSELEKTVALHSEKINFFVRTSLPPVEGIFYDGQIFDAYKFATDLIKSARKSLILIDNYVDESVLLMLSKRNPGVSATIYTQKITPQLQLDLDKHNDQYPPINIKTYRNGHDRFLIIDDGEVYHIGASLKDLGKKNVRILQTLYTSKNDFGHSMKDEDVEMKFKLEMDVITPIPRTITRKFSSLRHMRQWKNRNEIDRCLWCVNSRTYTRNEIGEWEQFAIFGKHIVLKSEMENALRHMAVKGYNQLTPEEWNELNRKLREER